MLFIPIWCGMTLLTETRLPEEIRFTGYQALIWHDVLEDTNLPLPDGTDLEVIRLVQEMTYQSFPRRTGSNLGSTGCGQTAKTV